jgi:hypothetical protein
LPTGDLTPEVYEAVMARWDDKAANTFNKHLSASTRSPRTPDDRNGSPPAPGDALNGAR